MFIKMIKALSDNYIWMIGISSSPEVILVDPGDINAVLSALKKNNYTPVAILITHYHYDHVNALAELYRRYKMPIYGPEKEAVPYKRFSLKENDQVSIESLDLTFDVLDMPGHTLGHIAFHIGNHLFCGDVLFAGGSGFLFEGTPTQMQSSVDKIYALADQTLLYCAHEYTQDNLRYAEILEPDNTDIQQRIGETQQLRKNNQATVPSLLELEKKTNPFLRTREISVVQSAETYADKKLPHASDVFACIRYWKDSLD
jgi:hydroxyacylglutathione hydrolase